MRTTISKSNIVCALAFAVIGMILYAVPAHAQEDSRNVLSQPRALFEKTRAVIFEREQKIEKKQLEVQEHVNEKEMELQKRGAEVRLRAEQFEDRVGEKIDEGDRAKKLEQVREHLLERKSDLEERRGQLEEKKEQVEERIAERAERVSEEVTKRIEKFLEHTEKKIDAAIERLQTLADRIESRILKIEERGVDVATAKVQLEIARVSINDAETSLGLALENARIALASGATRESFGKVVSELSHAKEFLREAHQALVEVIRTLKASVEDTTDNDESSDEESSTN